MLDEILKAPHHAVIQEDLAKKLGKGDADRGYKIISSMMKNNLLVVRPYSPLARDLPREAFAAANTDLLLEVVTLPTPGHVWAAKQQIKYLLAIEVDKAMS